MHNPRFSDIFEVFTQITTYNFVNHFQTKLQPLIANGVLKASFDQVINPCFKQDELVVNKFSPLGQ